MLTGQNGILRKGIEAKEETSRASEMEKINMAIYELKIEQQIENKKDIPAEDLQKRLNEQKEKNFLVVKWDKYIIFNLETNTEYRINEDGTTEYWGINNIGNILKNTTTANSKQIEQDVSMSNVIGVDNSGETINMCKWKYTLLDNGTYTLLSEESFKALNERRWEDIKNGYVGNFDENGRMVA